MKKGRKLLIGSVLFLLSCNQGGTTSTSSEKVSNGEENVSSSVEETTSSSEEISISSIDDTRITLEELQQLLIGDIGKNEILNSSKVEFQEIDKRGDSKTTTTKETMNIYKDYVTVSNGEEKIQYNNTDGETVVMDTYQSVATARAYGEQVVFYLVKDYADGTINSTWKDSAERLPVYEEGDPSYDGYYYLLSGSLPGQLTKQVSLIMYNFIGMYITGNPDLQTYMPYAHIERNGDATRYYLENFSYNYSDDSYNVNVEIGFSMSLENGYLKEVSTLYKTTYSRGDEIHIEEDTTFYNIYYEERVSSTNEENVLNVEDYFLSEVSEVKAYIYNDKGNKEYVSLNNLPLEKYVHFEASTYNPSKAVDIEMYPVSSSNDNVIYADANVFETLASGEATVTLESATGVTFEAEVRVNIPEITKIKYDDSASMIEKNGSTRYIYTSTTYKDSVYVSVNPSAAKLSDVEISVSDEDVLEVKSVVESKVISLELTVKDTDKESVSLILTSKTNPEIKTEIKYFIKQRLSDEEMSNKLLNNTYRWNNLYNSGQYGIMTFTSENEGQVTYYDGDVELGTTTFIYSFNGTSFNIKANSGSMFNYNSGEITLDGNQITARVDEVTYVHRYVIVEG